MYSVTSQFLGYYYFNCLVGLSFVSVFFFVIFFFLFYFFYFLSSFCTYTINKRHLCKRTCTLQVLKQKFIILKKKSSKTKILTSITINIYHYKISSFLVIFIYYTSIIYIRILITYIFTLLSFIEINKINFINDKC